VMSIAFMPDGRSFATASDAIKLWSASTGAELRRLGKSSSAIRAIAVSPDGRRLASAGPGQDTLKLWQIDSGREEQTLAPRHRQAGSEFYTAVAFSPDGAALASGSTDKTITLWDVS
jgi:WD40 repeat protein